MKLFAKARQLMSETLMENEELYLTYQAHVSWLLHDKYGITNKTLMNQAADDILSLLFSIPPKEPE